MTAEVITIGDEILIGQIVDSNSAFIAKELNKIGISVFQITSIQDDKLHILNALDEASARADIIIMTGGLGPTKDDVTKYTFCEYFDDRLELNEQVLEHIEELFKRYKVTPISDLNREQAMLPSKAEVLHNEYGTAPGMWMEKDKKVYISMPGVPYEMKELMEREVIPRLREKYHRPFIYHKTILTRGMGESAVANKLAAWEEKLPSHLKFAYMPDIGSVRLRISGKGQDEGALISDVEKQVEGLYEILGDIISDEQDEDETIAVQISKILTAEKKFLAAAESCTGGALAAEFTTHPGASKCFKGGMVSYATQTKVEMLQVKKELIEEFSVVSAEVAEAMARNARKLFKTDYALSTTGNAGPTKGDSDAEVGTVYIGLATPERTYSKKFLFGNHRDQVVKKAVYKAFEMILKEITA
ncbi:nicotinamide-nucleotide amidase [Salinimicrobium catena]|uniref:CinA-like protein n=1 Tax=Salinimicrobium catena TaxID=390640 RepID=A0A1H5NUS0_9FLAO|nr:competence/damage-inducible protein A [Salinimicrobium catena]SDL52289.1 nicotinamide-nucleotide amidase [Salinimicrobium catena]SEF04581.1 nicotinamide-nucleotide amidase [Salinimicrobium catena]